MKKLINFFGLMLLLLTTSMFMSCVESEPPVDPIPIEDFVIPSGEILEDGTILIDGSGLETGANEFIYYDLKDYVGKTIKVDFSCKMKTSNSSGVNLMWQILDDPNYPMVASNYSVKTDWLTLSGSTETIVKETDNFFFYLSTWNLNYSSLKIWLKDVELRITLAKTQLNADDEWTVAPSLKEAYEGKLDYIGMSVVRNEIINSNIQKGLKRHFNSITMGNEMKPDEFLGTYTVKEPKSFEDFTDSYGTTVKVPKNHLQFGVVDQCLNASKNIGAKMRGHVLVWHSQTADWFFKENYKSSGELVDKATMTARQEWYIKAVLEHIKEWEDKNNNGERIIYCWDVVNEAAEQQDYLRTDSNWYRIYKDDTFIVNAFRFANKYAPKDVLLAYNDYNEYYEDKRNNIIDIVKSVKKHQSDSTLPTRIDVIGMQSHLKHGEPYMSDYEATIRDFLTTGLDIHITELDIASKSRADADDNQKLKKAYKDCFKLYLRNAKTSSKNGITSVTIWGITDGSTWLNNDDQQPYLNNIKPQYPLLFTDNYYAKPAFYGVLEAAQESN